MGTDTESTADEFIRVMAELRALGDWCTNDHDERHAIRELRHAASNAIHDGLRRAQEAISVAHEVRRLAEEIKAAQAS